MAQISNGNLETICDEMARHAMLADSDPIPTAIATGGAYAVSSPNAGLLVANTDILGEMETLVTGFTDAEQQSDFVPPVTSLNLNTPLINQFIYSYWARMRQALNNHMARFSINAMQVGDRSPLDAALRVINETTLLRLIGTFQTYYGDISPSWLFTPTPFILGTITVTGASACTFTHVSAITGIYGQGQIAILNTQGNSGTTAVFTLSAIAGGLVLNPTVAVTSATNQELTAASDTSKIYVDCTNATVATGTADDLYAVVILPDRTIATA